MKQSSISLSCSKSGLIANVILRIYFLQFQKTNSNYFGIYIIPAHVKHFCQRRTEFRYNSYLQKEPKKSRNNPLEFVQPLQCFFLFPTDSIILLGPSISNKFHFLIRLVSNIEIISNIDL